MTDQQTLRDEAIATAYVRARQRLGAEHHSRLTKAWELVIDGGVEQRDKRLFVVKGKECPEYEVGLETCKCTDYTGGKAPNGYCKHVLAVMLYQRAHTLWEEAMTQASAPPMMPDLPEAPISICLKGTLHGVAGTLVTLRGWTMDEIEAQAQQVRQRAGCVVGIFDAEPVRAQPASATPQASVDAAPVCPDHRTPMKPSKFGGWYCTQSVGDGYCKQQAKPRKREPYRPPEAAMLYGD